MEGERVVLIFTRQTEEILLLELMDLPKACMWLISRLQIALEYLQVKNRRIILRRFLKQIILCFVSLGHGRREYIRT